MVNNEQIRNTRLDVLKVVCCILVIVLYSPQLCGGVVGEFIRALTAVAVPTFMAISGYLIFYVKEYTGKKYFKILIKYMTIFLIWDAIYLTYAYISSQEEMPFMQYAIINSEGWHLWYLKVYVQILLAYPIIRAITKERKLCILFSLIWLVMIPLKYSMATYFGIDGIYLRLLQLPFFQFSGVVSGTTMGYYPTECLGYFILGGLLIDLVEKSDKYKIAMIIIGLVGLMMTMFGQRYSETASQPLQLSVFFMMTGFISLMYLPHIKTGRITQNIVWMSDKTLGVYIIQGFTLRLSKHIISKILLGSSIENIMICLLTIISSFIIVAIIHKVIPSKICQYIM